MFLAFRQWNLLAGRTGSPEGHGLLSVV